ncbi:MAG TPA: class I SAM-dependent methyltransferase [Candidatus Dormibacteraeota bacterium]|jgi:cyclopropane fatty-acyl-phospholipid synthase-like methyltransferase|nr:class I SAM-dependent methyltransferase [Candidatus Dormibacteraeota bacterium]
MSAEQAGGAVFDIYGNGEYLNRNPGWHVEHSAWKVSHLDRIVARNSLQPATVCSIGCGAGEVLRLFQAHRDHPCECWGFDISPQAIELAMPRATETLHFEQVDIADVRGKFDLAMVLDVVEHVENPFEFLRQLRSRAHRVLLHVPLDLSAQSVVRSKPLTALRDAHGHLHYYTKETVLRMLEDTGFKVVDYHYTSMAMELPCDVLTRKLLRWPRKLLFRLNQDLASKLLGGCSLMILARPIS